MTRLRVLGTFVLVFVVGLGLMPIPAVCAGPGDWPQWRGPDRSGRSADTGLLQEWPQEGPPLLWKVEGLGTGFSPVSAVGGRLYGLGYRTGGEYVFALDRGTGKEVWATRIGTAVKEAPGMRWLSQRAPTVDGERLYATSAYGDLVCLETDQGKELWHKNYLSDFGGKRTSWGYCDYPLVDGDRLICTPGGPTATLAALDKRTGDVLWKAAVPGGDAADYSPVVVAEVGGLRQYVQLLSRGLVGVAAQDGRFLWRYDKIANGTINIPTPVVQGDLIFCAGGYGKRCALLRLVPEADGIKVQEVYGAGQFQSDSWHTGPVLIGDHLYATNTGAAFCTELMTGKVVWRQTGLPIGRSVSVVHADGHLYLRGLNGLVALVEATPKGYVSKGSFQVPLASKEQGWTAPVIAGGRLFVRDQGVLSCYDLRRPAERHAEPPSKPVPRPRFKAPDAIYVPTPQEVVEKMLELAEVKKGDVVYDLGCGDGRIVVTAAQKYGARSVGIDIDAERVEESLANVRKHKVEGLVTIKQANLFTEDIREATVVTLYLLPELNVKLLPQLRQLKPGARIVSHAFDIRGVKPTQVLKFRPKEGDGEHTLYLWVVPLEQKKP